MTPGEFFKKKRAEKGATTRAIGKAAGISHVHVQNIEKGRADPSLSLCDRLLNALDASWPEFLAAIGYQPTEE